MKKISLLIIFCTAVVCSNAQNNRWDSIAVARAQNIVNLAFASDSVPQNYLVFTFGTCVMLISKMDDGYKTQYYETIVNGLEVNGARIDRYDYLGGDGRLRRKDTKLECRFLDAIFGECLVCEKEEVFFPEDIPVNWYTYRTYWWEYFVLYRNGDKICEYHIPPAGVENYGEWGFPLNKDYRMFLLGKIWKKIGAIK